MPSRTLLLMQRSLDSELPSAEELPLRSFLPGLDEEAWLALNSRCFAEHPEQGRLSLADLRERMAQDWFDPHGFLIYEVGQMLGFCWTKVHSPERGEIYVVGVDPSQRGQGLGRKLAVAGLHYLQSRDLHEAILYVDESNNHALALYQDLGFREISREVLSN